LHETLYCSFDILNIMILIDGKKAAAELREELKKEVTSLKEKYNKSPRINSNFDR
jgi:5,10-methylene-tetrahydrofolate dehydrogenase/methenyl tetrahydrofolate cyclohydrolase